MFPALEHSFASDEDSSTRNNHYQCVLFQADGSLDLENNRNAGDATDLFSEVSGVALFDVTTRHQVGGSTDNLKRSYDTTSTPGLGDFIGLSMEGGWQLQVRDLARLDTGTLISWSIQLEY